MRRPRPARELRVKNERQSRTGPDWRDLIVPAVHQLHGTTPGANWGHVVAREAFVDELVRRGSLKGCVNK
jgi:hypothetical protein